MRKSFNPLWVALLFVTLTSSWSFAATFTWTNTAGGNWTTAANWSPAGPPTAADTALITTSGTYTITNSAAGVASVLTLGGATGTQTLLLSGGSLTLGTASTGNAQAVVNITGGTLGGVGSLVLAGPMNWSGGTITNSVQFDGGTFSGSLNLNAGQVINTGTLNWTSASINGGNGSVISNALGATLNLSAPLNEGSFGGTRTFNNSGFFNVAVAGVANISDVFNNSGSITVSNGTLNVSGGGTESGLFFAFPGGTNEFSGGTFTMTSGSVITGFGTWLSAGGVENFFGTAAISNATVNITGGTVNLDNSSVNNFPVLNLSNGTLTGTNPVTVVGAFTWSSGSVNSNLVQFNGGTFSGTLGVNFGGEVINTGTLSWTAPTMNTGNGSIISNAPAGTINLSVNLNEGSFGGVRTFNNAGQLNVTVSAVATITETFNNTGTVAINTGTLDLSGGGTESGAITVASGATNEFGGGTFVVNSGASISGSGTWTSGGGISTFAGTSSLSTLAVNIISGTVNFNNSTSLNFASLNQSGGTLAGSNPVLVSGPFNWSGGSILTNTVQFNGGTFSVSLTLNNGGQVINTGTLNWTASSLNDGSSVISNAPTGTINVSANFNEGSLGGTRTFNNAGQLNASAPGTATFSSIFNSTGSVAVNGGTLDFNGGGTESGPFTAVSGATLDFGGGTFAINSGGISGAGNFLVAGGVVTVGVGLNLTGTWTFSGGTASLSSTTVSGNAVFIPGGIAIFGGAGPWRPGTLSISTGTLEGTTPVTVLNSGGMAWTGGSILTNLVQFSGGSFSNNLTLNNGGQVINTGTLSWAATSMNTGGSLISNAPAAIINMSANFNEGSFGGTRTFNNAGQLNVSVPATAAFSSIFNSTGSVAVNGGTLDFNGGGIGSGSFTAASGATLEFDGGTYSINSGSVSGAGNFLVAAGAVTVGVGLNMTGTWTFSGGTCTLNSTTVSSNAVIVSGATAIFSGTGPWQPGTLTISSGTLGGTTPVTVQNSGGMTWTGGSILTNLVQFTGGSFSNNLTLNDGGQVVNTGTLNWAATSLNSGLGSLISNAPAGVINWITNFNEGSFGGVRTFNNAGQLNVGLSGTATIGDNFTNSGIVTFSNGVLNLSGTHNLAGGTFNFGINALNNYGSNVLGGAAGLAGTLKSVFNGGYLPSVGNTYNIMTYGSSTGNFTVTNLSPLAVWTVNQNSTALSITVVKLVPRVAWSTPGDIVYGTALSGSQLNASATWNGTNVPGVFNYTPVSGTVLNSGSNQVLSLNFVPTDLSTFTNVTTNVLITVQKAPLMVTATNITKTYGQTYTFAGTEFTTSGLVNGDVVTSATFSSPGQTPTANVAGSPYTINVTNALGDAGLTNYNISYATGLLTVNRANLAITANNQSKTYGQVFTFIGTEFTPVGLQNSETVGSVSLSSPGQPATASVAGSPYSITASAATGGTFDPNNYSISYFPGNLTVNKAPLGITANSTNKIYGQTVTFAGTEFVPSGLQNSETVGSVSLTSPGQPATASVASSPYNIVPSAATGGTFNSGNYSITYTNGILTVNKAPLGITANSTNKTYGQTVTFAGTEFVPSGLQNSETVGSVSLTSPGQPATASVAGSPYNIVTSAATGGTFSPGNYLITYTNGVLTVGKAPLTITADNTNKIVGESLTFAGTEFTSSGLQNSETVGTVTLTSTGQPAGAAVGGYPIVPSAPTGGTFAQGNYSDAFNNGTLTVIGAPSLAIIANGAQDTLTFQAILGQKYQVQAVTNLTNFPWPPLGAPISNTNGTVNVTNSISNPQTFYRLQIQFGP
jgi:hypothetical protein